MNKKSGKNLEQLRNEEKMKWKNQIKWMRKEINVFELL